MFSILLLLAACSTKKNAFANRNFQALNTKYNVLYHGNNALEKGKAGLIETYQDNFWDVLPIERFQEIDLAKLEEEKAKNPDFERAEDKSIKSIQKRSMLIQGIERNPQMDEAHILLGKTRYYQQRFIPALEAFNYVLYKYPRGNQLAEAKLWREKTNIRLENETVALENLNKLLKETKFKKQTFADAHAIMAQAHINLEELDSASVKLEKAVSFTKKQEEKARYLYILGHLYQKQNQKDLADASFQKLINMHRKSPKSYWIHAHVQQSLIQNPKNIDSVVWLKKANKLIADYENNKYFDALYYQKAWYYDAIGNAEKAKKLYKTSLKYKKNDKVLTAKVYQSLAEIYFNEAKYVTAGKYYDSTLVYLTPKTREHRAVAKKIENLADVIKYEGIATTNDSIIKIWQMSEAEREKFFSDYIVKLKKQDALLAKLQKEQQKKEEIQQNNQLRQTVTKSDLGGDDMMAFPGMPPPSMEETSKGGAPAPPVSKSNTSVASASGSGTSGQFYFYNQTLVENGKREFIRVWGKRTPGTYWRYSQNKNANPDESKEEEKEKKKELDGIDESDERYSVAYYTDQLPKSEKEIDSLKIDRNFAWYQLGLIYKEKFKELERASTKFHSVLNHQPEEKLVLPSMYHLYKIYELQGNTAQANLWKNRIIQEFPKSRYATILSGKVVAEDVLDNDPRIAYKNLYKQYELGNYLLVHELVEVAINKFVGDEIVPKLELLKASLTAKLEGVEAYKNSLNYLVLNYPNAAEGKAAAELLNTQVPKLEAMALETEEATTWKIVFELKSNQEVAKKVLLEKLDKFLENRQDLKLKKSVDIYNLDTQMVILHQIKSETLAKELVSLLKDAKEYQVAEKGVVISSENYKVVQAKKQWELFKNPPKP